MSKVRSHVLIHVRRSAIEGTGLFAGQSFRPRMKLGEMSGERISVREGRRRAKGAARIVIVELDERTAIDGSVGDSPFQYVNHSCAANVYIRTAYGRVEFYARRRIDPGEELTCDYGASHHNGKLSCCCGAPNCRGFL